MNHGGAQRPLSFEFRENPVKFNKFWSKEEICAP